MWGFYLKTDGGQEKISELWTAKWPDIILWKMASGKGQKILFGKSLIFCLKIELGGFVRPGGLFLGVLLEPSRGGREVLFSYFFT